jgi:hypothetical protein
MRKISIHGTNPATDTARPIADHLVSAFEDGISNKTKWEIAQLQAYIFVYVALALSQNLARIAINL